MIKNRLRDMEEKDLEQVRQWRNHPDVRKYMYTNHKIGIDEHKKWFVSVNRSDATLLIFERERIPAGFVSISRGRCDAVADWGFYVAPDSPKGTGRALGVATLAYAFDKLRLHKLCGQALYFNERSIMFHKNLGFTQEGRLREQHFDGHSFHDIICFGLLACEWKMNNSEKNDD